MSAIIAFSIPVLFWNKCRQKARSVIRFNYEIENICSRVPIRYRNTSGSLGEREIEVRTRARSIARN